MPLFQIRRDVPGLVQEDIDAAGLRALICADEFTGLRWIQSQWDEQRGVLFCLYEANSTAEVFEHARRARIPCDDVFEVRQIGPEDYFDAVAQAQDSERVSVT